jgi:hypothetical protein
MVDKVKNAMMKVAVGTGVTLGLNQNKQWDRNNNVK